MPGTYDASGVLHHRPDRRRVLPQTCHIDTEPSLTQAISAPAADTNCFFTVKRKTQRLVFPFQP